MIIDYDISMSFLNANQGFSFTLPESFIPEDEELLHVYPGIIEAEGLFSLFIIPASKDNATILTTDGSDVLTCPVGTLGLPPLKEAASTSGVPLITMEDGIQRIVSWNDYRDEWINQCIIQGCELRGFLVPASDLQNGASYTGYLALVGSSEFDMTWSADLVFLKEGAEIFANRSISKGFEDTVRPVPPFKPSVNDFDSMFVLQAALGKI